jgi:hypothetical protein
VLASSPAGCAQALAVVALAATLAFALLHLRPATR